ncbi:MAG: hypothetical protein DMF74_22530 [Acidobacteria bacterium]|nr:MAG: hypothetical protein DMF74_22530 [Acidobacteriota bacterium]
METLLKDVRYGIRSLLKQPAFTAIAVITLALGIAGNTVIFSAVNSLLVKPLAFPELDRMVAIWEARLSQGVERNEVTMADYLDWRKQNQTFEQMGLYRWWSANLTGVEPPERIQGFLVSTNFLDVTGVKPFIGRAFSAEEDQPGKDAVVILNYGLWQRRFGGDANIVNKTVSLNGVKRTIIGVLPKEFNYPSGMDVMAPLALTPELASNRDNHTYYVLGRLKQNVSLPLAQTDLSTIAARLEKDYPQANTGHGVVVYPIVEDTVRFYARALWVLMGAVGFVLLIACANVANLTLARSSTRQREIALRLALGASRSRIIRQLLTESVMVALIGGALGVLIAYWGIDAMRAANPGEAAKFAPGWEHLGINFPVLVFTLGVSVLSGALFGLAPAWQASKPDLNDALKEGGRTTSSSHRLRNALVVCEVALALMLLVSAGLLLRSFLSLLNTDPGFNSTNLLTMKLVLPAAKYKDDQARAAFYSELLNRIRVLPGVESVAAVNYLPLGGSNSSDIFLIEGLPEPPPGQEFIGRYRVCTPDYFQTMGIPILKGRAFTEQDKVDAPRVVIVNETLAQRYWPNQDPINKRMRFTGPLEKNPWIQVVGVVKDVKHALSLPMSSDYYLPQNQDTWSSMVLVAKTKTEPMSMAAPIRQQVWAIDKDEPVFDVRTMQQVRALSVALYSFSSVTLTIFAAVALILSAVGIYGVMAYVVTQRTHEIGIRMALGARSRDVLRLVVRHGMTLALIGVGVGLGGAWALTR